MTVMELFGRKRIEKNGDYDYYEAVMGAKLDVESLLYIRELEDFWIELGHIAEDHREPVPEYLREEWIRAVGPDEINRIHIA